MEQPTAQTPKKRTARKQAPATKKTRKWVAKSDKALARANQKKIHKAQLLAALKKHRTHISNACEEVGLSREAYYHYLSEDPEFSKKVNEIAEFLTDNAKGVVVDAIFDKDLKAAQWWLERKNKDEFSPRQELTGVGGKPLLMGGIPYEDLSPGLQEMILEEIRLKRITMPEAS